MVTAGRSDAESTTLQEQAATLAEAFRRALIDREVDSVDEYHHADMVYNPSGDVELGRADLKQTIDRFLTAFPDLDLTITEQLVDGQQVCVYYEIAGHHMAQFRDVSPTGEYVTAGGIALAKFEGEKIAEFTLVFDAHGMRREMNALE